MNNTTRFVVLPILTLTISVLTRIVKNDQLSGSRSVHTFVNMLNGDILKAGGWSAPQKNGVRGNIFADDLGANRVNEHGANYLK